MRIALGQGVDGEAARTRQPAFLTGAEGALAYAALPLVHGERLIGVLALQAGGKAPQVRDAQPALLEIAAAAAEEIDAQRREQQVQTRAT